VFETGSTTVPIPTLDVRIWTLDPVEMVRGDPPTMLDVTTFPVTLRFDPTPTFPSWLMVKVDLVPAVVASTTGSLMKK
jgi:hypothetical protein